MLVWRHCHVSSSGSVTGISVRSSTTLTTSGGLCENCGSSSAQQKKGSPSMKPKQKTLAAQVATTRASSPQTLAAERRVSVWIFVAYMASRVSINVVFELDNALVPPGNWSNPELFSIIFVGNIFQWNLKQNHKCSIQRIVLENVVDPRGLVAGIGDQRRKTPRLVPMTPPWRLRSCTQHRIESQQNKAWKTMLILGLRPAKERRRYFVATSLIGWAQT